MTSNSKGIWLASEHRMRCSLTSPLAKHDVTGQWKVEIKKGSECIPHHLDILCLLPLPGFKKEGESEQKEEVLRRGKSPVLSSTLPFSCFPSFK